MPVSLAFGGGSRRWRPWRRSRWWHGVGGSGVSLEEGAVGEALGAEAALEALGSVGAHVDVEGALLSEALAADTALEGANARVGHHVLQQVVAEGEGAPADGALVGLLACGETNGSTWGKTDQHGSAQGEMGQCGARGGQQVRWVNEE